MYSSVLGEEILLEYIKPNELYGYISFCIKMCRCM